MNPKRSVTNAIEWLHRGARGRSIPLKLFVGGVGALAAVGLSWTAFAAFGSSSETDGEAQPPQAESHLRVCIDRGAGVQSSLSSPRNAAAAVASSLGPAHDSVQQAKAKLDPNFHPVPFNQPEVGQGCPAGVPAVPADAAVRVDAPVGPTAAVPDDGFQIHIFVVPGVELAKYPQGFLRTDYRQACEGDVCAETSTALFVTEGLMADGQATTKAFESALGWADYLNPAYPAGHPDGEHRAK